MIAAKNSMEKTGTIEIQKGNQEGGGYGLFLLVLAA